MLGTGALCRGFLCAASLYDFEEGDGEFGVEFRAATVEDLADGLVRSVALTVGPVGGHRAECVGEAEDPCCLRDLGATQSAGIAFAIETLVVVTDQIDDRVLQLKREAQP